jgi:transcription elongation factor GreB
MSKAFTKEEGGAADLLPVRPRAPAGRKRPITPEGRRALEEELAGLLAQGGLSGGGPAAPTEVGAEARVRRAQGLLEALEDTEVLAPPEAPRAVAFGVWVTLEDAEEGAPVTYRLVGSDEADARAGRLSVESPLARALLGREVGESVAVERPRGALEYTVVRVSAHPPREA